MRAPMMSIHTVAAGGGSILAFDGARLRVGPQSAGANPGPASYRRGGPLAVTDANVMVGKIQPRYFPQVFGPGADEPLDAARRAAAVRGAGRAGAAATGRPTAPKTWPRASSRIAVQQMANAIKKISVARGYDVTRYTLQCFGGAGGQHACLVADALGMTRVLVHPLAGVLSAYGMGLADQIVIREAGGRAAAGRGRRCRRSRERWTRWPTPRAAELADAGRGAPARCAAAPAACTCATRAPTRRWSCRLASSAAHRRRVRGRLPPALRLPDAGQGRWSSRRCRSRPWCAGERRPSRATPLQPAREVPRPRDACACTRGGAMARTAALVRARGPARRAT